MAEKILLVDFENVQQVDFSQLNENFRIFVFVGANQKSVPFELVSESQKMGDKVTWQKIEGNGSNALDFHIAMHLGMLLQSKSNALCTVLSKDKGFDPLIKYLNKVGLNCNRINSLLELTTKPIETNEDYARVLEFLRKMPSRNLPRRRKSLTQHIWATCLQKKSPISHIEKIVDLLFIEKIVSETNNVISYTL